MTVPEGVTTDNVKAESASTQSLTTNVADGILYVGFLDMSGKGVTFADNKLVTITISLPTALTAPVALTLTSTKQVSQDNNGAVYCMQMV